MTWAYAKERAAFDAIESDIRAGRRGLPPEEIAAVIEQIARVFPGE